MDFILFSGLKEIQVDHVRISYDIACQWHVNLKKRMQSFPRAIQIVSPVALDFGIPKFHLHGHGASCQSKFSFNYLPGSGRTCGEGVETDWSVMNIVGASTREMSPSGRQETLDDHWGHWNWRKVTGFRTFYAEYHFQLMMELLTSQIFLLHIGEEYQSQR